MTPADGRDFTGNHERTLDDKGRLVIPRDHRDQLSAGERLHLVPGQDTCLQLMPADVYSDRKRGLQAESRAGGVDARMALRVFTAFSDPISVDRAGRIGVPRQLRSYAGIDAECVVIGAGDFIEIWSEDGWQQALGIGVAALARAGGGDLGLDGLGFGDPGLGEADRVERGGEELS